MKFHFWLDQKPPKMEVWCLSVRDIKTITYILHIFRTKQTEAKETRKPFHCNLYV